MKILHCANFSLFPRARKSVDDRARIYAIDRKLSAGLIRGGHSVFDFSYRDAARFYGVFGKRGGAKKMNRALIETAAKLHPDLLLLGHCELVFAETLAEIRKCIPQIKIAQWWVDPFWNHQIGHLQEKRPQLDAFFSTTHPAAARRFVDAERGGGSPPFYFMPNICDSSVETERAFDNPNPQYDIFFAGRPDPSREELIDALNKMKDEARIGIFGITRDTLLGGHQFIRAIGESKIGISFNRMNDIEWYASDRIVQLAGNGCLVFTPRIPGFEKLFAKDEVVYFDSLADLPNLLRAYLRDDDRRIQIARAGWMRAHQSYNERRIARFVIESIFGEKYTEDYEWKNEAAR